MDGYIKFHLVDLPVSEFYVSLKDDLQRELIEKAAKIISNRSHGKYTDLAVHLKKTCRSLDKITAESIVDRNISRWKDNKMFLPIDCVLELCNLTSTEISLVENKISLIKEKMAYDSRAMPFNFYYDIPFATLGEAIKTEGHIKKSFNQCSISNESVDFVNFIDSQLHEIGIRENNIYKFLKIEVRLPTLNVKKIVDQDGKEFKFSVQSKRQKVLFCDNFYSNKKSLYKINLASGEDVYVNVEIPQKGKISAISSHGICSVSININVTNKTFCKLLKLLTNVPVGKKSNIIRVCPLLFSSSNEIKRSVISVIFAAEGWVEKKVNRIRFFVNSEEYIDDVKKLLESFKIKPTLNNRNYLSISSREDLVKFSNNFDLIIKEKRDNLSFILKSYSRVVFRHYEGLLKTLEVIKNNKLTANQIASILNKHKDTAFFHLNNGKRRGYISVDVTKWPYIYSITPKGLEFIGEKHDSIGN